MTKAAELAELDDDELQNKLAASRRELLNLRFQLATGQLDNTERIGEVRRDIARSLTILRERDISEQLVELEPLVLTPARRIPLDDTGGVDDEADVDEDEDEDAIDVGEDEPEATADDTDDFDEAIDEEDE
jgi:large subunit ribosomal protein L29